MRTWRYAARPVDEGSSATNVGEITAASAADARTLLRQAGLRVTEIRELGRSESIAARLPMIARRMRARRTARKAELFDSLATMLDSGIALGEAIAVLAGAVSGRRDDGRLMLVQLRDAVHGGDSLATAMSAHALWFDAAEIAMVRAGERSGQLTAVLRGLAARGRERDELVGKLIAALTYPTVVLIVGLAVVVFLSQRTLPSLVGILEGGGVTAPLLTRGVIAAGDALVRFGWIMPLVVVGIWFGARLIRSGRSDGAASRRFVPRAIRAMLLARTYDGLAQLTRAGVPLVDAMQVLAPTLGGFGAGHARAQLREAVRRIERGDDASAALGAEPWLNDEHRKLLQVGDEAGELETAMRRLADRFTRQAARRTERLMSALEPTVIVVLAGLVGLVVMAAVLPMLRLQQLV
jgi:type II secretory pathway component PulF